MKANQGTHWEFTLSEFKTLLFKKKVCPICGKELKRHTTYEVRATHQFGELHPHIYTKDPIMVKENKIFYTCLNCGRDFSLEELGKKD